MYRTNSVFSKYSLENLEERYHLRMVAKGIAIYNFSMCLIFLLLLTYKYRRAEPRTIHSYAEHRKHVISILVSFFTKTEYTT